MMIHNAPKTHDERTMRRYTRHLHTCAALVLLGLLTSNPNKLGEMHDAFAHVHDADILAGFTYRTYPGDDGLWPEGRLARVLAGRHPGLAESL